MLSTTELLNVRRKRLQHIEPSLRATTRLFSSPLLLCSPHITRLVSNHEMHNTTNYEIYDF